MTWLGRQGRLRDGTVGRIEEYRIRYGGRGTTLITVLVAWLEGGTMWGDDRLRGILIGIRLGCLSRILAEGRKGLKGGNSGIRLGEDTFCVLASGV